MRIAMVHSSFAIRGGAEQYVRDLSRDLAQRGHDVRVFTRASSHREPVDRHVGRRLSARLAGGSAKAGKLLTHLGDLVDPTGLTVRDLAEFNPDVVHLHNWQGLGIGPVARLAETFPTCHTVHDYAIADPNNALANRGRSKPSDLLLSARSALLVRRLRNVELLWPAERTRDILYRHVPGVARLDGRIVPLAVFTGRVPQPVPPIGAPQIFLYLGALSPHKGVDLMLDAWRAMPPVPGRLLIIGGDGALRGHVEAAARADPSLQYAGYLDETGKAEALHRAGWLLFPSQWAENFPISCVEALRAGRPIIASTVARPPMAADGSLLTFDGREELSRALATAAAMPDPDYRAMVGSALADGRRLDWDAHVDAVLGAYIDLRARRNQRS